MLMWPHCFETLASVSSGHSTAWRGYVSLLGFEVPPCTVWVYSCLLSVQPLMHIQHWSVTEELVCVVHAGNLSWGNEWSCSNWWALLCGKHVSGLCLINLQIIDSSVKSQFLTLGQIPLRREFMPCSYYNRVKKSVRHETRVPQKRSLMSPRGWRKDVFPRHAGAWGGLTPVSSSSVLPKS